MRVSVIILNWNGKKYLRDCLDSVLAQNFPSFEVLLIDNGSTDGSVAYAKKRYKDKIRIIENKKNLGFAEGNNVGVRNAKGKYIVLLNNDTKVCKDWLEELVRTIELETWKGKKILVAGSLGMNPEQQAPNLEAYNERKVTMSINLAGELVSVDQDEHDREQNIKTVFYMGGLSLIFPRKDFSQPFEPVYFAYAEDVYLGWLARLRGGTVVINTQSRLHHYGGGTKKSGKRISEISVFNGTKNQIVNFLAFYELKNIIRILPLFLFTQIAHVVHNPRKIIVKAKALIWVCMNIGRIRGIRKDVQKQRKASDKELIGMMSCMFFDPRHTKSGALAIVARIMNPIFCLYCRLVGLRTVERHNN